MKRFLPFLAVFFVALAPAAFAQGTYSYSSGGDHAEVGVYGNFFRWNDQDIDFAGLGARVAFNVSPFVQLEAEMGYDFAQAFPERFSNGGSVTVVNSNLRVLDGLFGPKFQTNKGPVRLFLTVKGGFMNFRFDPRSPGFNTFVSSVENLRAGNVKGTVYPGVGAEAYWGPIGLRFDAGDEIYFNNGARNNLRIAFGPTLRF